MRKKLPILILLFAVLYIFFIPEQPTAMKIFFKLVPMLLIILYTYRNQQENKPIHYHFIFFGLIFCMFGDGLLIWFVVGLTAFLIGHIFYTIGFFKVWNYSLARFLSFIPILAYGIFMSSKFITALNYRNENELIIPVILYIAVISMMFWSAIMSGQLYAIIGSFLFVISDSVLAWNKFISSVPFSGSIIMITYYTAQFLIAFSLFHLTVNQVKKQKPNTPIPTKG